MAEKRHFYSKVFTFESNHNDNWKESDLVITIPEAKDPSYGMYVWPSAPVLARYIWHQRSRLARKHVLEALFLVLRDLQPNTDIPSRMGHLTGQQGATHMPKLGSGTALPGIVAAKVGAHVTLSDKSDLPDCLERSRHSCSVNGLGSITVKGITWGQFEPDLVDLPAVDVVVAADCFYNSKDFEPVLVTVVYLLGKNPELEFWTAYQVRSSERNIEHLLRKWDLDCTLVPLSSFDADHPCIAGSSLPGCHTIQMLIIRGKHRREVPKCT